MTFECNARLLGYVYYINHKGHKEKHKGHKAGSAYKCLVPFVVNQVEYLCGLNFSNR